MYTARRKRTYCQNCHYPLPEEYNFCSNCGQENSDKLVTFWTLSHEFFSNLIAYDSRLLRTLRPFLFKPGFLTIEFIAGKRTAYMHPLRLYFIVSFFYFLALSLSINRQTESYSMLGEDQANETPIANQAAPIDTLAVQGDTLTVRILRSPTQANPSTEEEESILTIFSQKISYAFLKNKQTTPAMVVDSLGWKHNRVNHYIVNQLIKFVRSDSRSIDTYFREYLLSKGSIMMFLLLPIFALILKIFYIRRKRYYVEHLTFALHIHAFTFLIFLLMILFERPEWISSLLTLALIIYILLAFKRVYRQGWVKTVLKSFMLFVSYMMCFGLAIMIMVIIGGLIY